MRTARDPIDFLLVGGGLASATAAEALRNEGAEGRIVIVGAEPHLPYHRPPLSGRLKRAGAPPEPLPVLKDDELSKLGIELLRGTRAMALDVERKELHTDTGGTLAWKQLLIATGAAPQRLAVPGAELAGIHTLRTIEDARAIHAAAERGGRCVVVGAGFIGMEVSSGLRQRGIEVSVVTGPGGVFQPLHDDAIAGFFTGLYAEHGIAMAGGSVAGFEGTRGKVRAVVLQDGRRLPCDFCVVGIGVRPQLDWLAGSGIVLDDGVKVDRYLQASAPGVWAAGDVASFDDPVFRVRRRIEHWDNAVKQGRVGARNMLGQRVPYDEVSGFFCQVFDVNFQFAGRAEGAPARRSLGSPQQRSWARLYLREAVPRALFTMGRPAQETATIQALIRYRTSLAKYDEDLQRPGYVLGGIPSQTVLVLQGGGALGAFECGVARAMHERGIRPDIVAGVSIGAFNGAIIASNPDRAAEALESFWHDLAVASPPAGDEASRQWWGAASTLLFGVPAFFTPQWLRPWTSPQDALAPWTAFYDHAPARRLLRQYVDFESLAASPVRLLVSAVDVESGQLAVFDSYVDEFTVDHVLASGSLPPGLPWTTIAGHHYWDGGIVSNSPLEQVHERCGIAGKRAIVVDLYAQARPLPSNLMEVLARRDEIVYAERVRRAGHEQQQLRDARRLVEGILGMVDGKTADRIRQLPPYVQLMGAPDAPTITRIVRDATAAEPTGRDFDFSLASIRAHMQAGLLAGRHALQQAPGSSAHARG